MACLLHNSNCKSFLEVNDFMYHLKTNIPNVTSWLPGKLIHWFYIMLSQLDIYFVGRCLFYKSRSRKWMLKRFIFEHMATCFLSTHPNYFKAANFNYLIMKSIVRIQWEERAQQQLCDVGKLWLPSQYH